VAAPLERGKWRLVTAGGAVLDMAGIPSPQKGRLPVSGVGRRLLVTNAVSYLFDVGIRFADHNDLMVTRAWGGICHTVDGVTLWPGRTASARAATPSWSGPYLNADFQRAKRLYRPRVMIPPQIP
jgi:hypothetical protein